MTTSNSMTRKRLSTPGRSGCVPAILGAAMLAAAAGCESPFQRIDRRTKELLLDTNVEIGPDTAEPRLSWTPGKEPDKYRGEYLYADDPPTENPAAATLTFTPAGDAQGVLERLDQYAQTPPDVIDLDLIAALEYAVQNSREYRFAEEEYVLEALRLLIERHRWGPRLFNDTTLQFVGLGNNGLYDTSLQLVNDFRVTQKLPYGGEVSAQFLAQATWDLHERVAGENVQTADLILGAEVPLLRGAGMVAREDLIQAERNVVYAARRFERFRREFLTDITTDFLNLVIQQQAIWNTEANVKLLEGFEAREVALARAGRTPPFDAADAAQNTLFRRDDLNAQLEAFRLSLDRFKVRLGMPQPQAARILPSSPGLPTPKEDLEQAVRAAMHYRLDLQNQRDLIDDARRNVNNSRNALLADLDLFASVTVPTNPDKQRAGLDFAFDDTAYEASLVLGLPIDRTIERLDLRESQVTLERTIREYERFRDDIAVQVRAAVRNIDRALFSKSLQARNVRIADLRVASIEAAPDRANSTDRSRAAEQLLQAQDSYLVARRDLQLAILAYLLESGQLRVEPAGTLRPLEGMELRMGEALDLGDIEALPEPGAPDLAGPNPLGPDGQLPAPPPESPPPPAAPAGGGDTEK